MPSEIPDPDVVRLSGDSHVAEPPDLWERNMPAKLKDRALRLPNAAQFERRIGAYSREGGWVSKAALVDAAGDGISAQAMFPTFAGNMWRQFFDKPLDLELVKAEEQVYNDWMIEYCSEDFDRLWGLGMIGLWDIDYAIDEMHRTIDAGLKGVSTWVAPPDDIPWTGDHYERFWSAAEEARIPICMHINSGFGEYQTRRDDDQRFKALSRQAWGHKAIAMRVLSDMILTGVFERHPNLTIVLAEFECGWIPFFLEDLDRKYANSHLPGQVNDFGLSLLPSEYFSRNVYSTFLQDGVAGYLLERWGADNFIYSNDYPHPGGIWPHTDDTILLTLSKLPTETRVKVLGANLAKAFNVPLPTPVAREAITGYTDETWTRPWLKKADGEFTFEKSKMGLAL